jgi:hypothetical protein
MSSIAASPGKIHLLDGSTQIKGVTEATITDKTTSEDITNDADTAVRRGVTIDDANFSFTFIYDSTPDPGQQGLFTKKAAHTPINFTRYLKGTSGPNYTLTGYISEISTVDAQPGKELKFRVTVDVTGGAVFNSS